MQNRLGHYLTQAEAVRSQCMRPHWWIMFMGIDSKCKGRARAQALGAQCFSLRRKMKNTALKIFMDDVKRLGHCFTQAEAVHPQ